MDGSRRKDLLLRSKDGGLDWIVMREEKLFYVYIVANRSRVIYVGFSSDLYQRVMQHRSGTFAGFTSQYGCKRLVWYERYGSAVDAITREKQIKHWRREKKIHLIELDNPTWEDLSKDWGLPIAPFVNT